MPSFLPERLKSEALPHPEERYNDEAMYHMVHGEGSQSGVSLIESLLVVVVVAAIVLLMVNLPNAMTLVSKSRHLSLTREIVAKQIEDKRATSYINLVNDTTAINDSRIALLPNGSGQVVVENCDPQICTNSENIKQITVTINWKENNKPQTVSFKTLIGEGGLNQ